MQQWQSSTAMRNGARGADRGEVQWHFLVMEMVGRNGTQRVDALRHILDGGRMRNGTSFQ